MGHPVLQTPNIDALADHGTVWDRFYVASPVCMPNRASFMTARMPSSHGVRMNGIPLDKRNVTFVDLLRDAGYKTALIGKSHLQTFSGKEGQLKRPVTRDGFHKAEGELSEAVRHDHDSYRVEDARENKCVPGKPFYGFDHAEIVTHHGDGCRGNYREWLLEQEPNADSLLGAENQLPHDYACPQAIRTALPEDLYSTSWVADRAVAWLEENADDGPFFLMVSFPDPHHPFNPPGKYWDMYDPDDMPVPKALREDWQPPPHVAAVHAARAEGRARLKGMGAIGTSTHEAQEAQALSCGMITMIDDAVGRVRAAARGDEVTIFTTDHGDHLGDHGMLFKGSACYDEITRVPMIWHDPAAPNSNRTQAFGQTIDIGPTILERAKIEPAIGMQGRSLFAEPRDHAFIQYEHQVTNAGLGGPPRVHSIRSADWRISVFHGVTWGELYDLKNDPGELYNLWDAPEAAEAKAQMMEALLRAEIAHVDNAPHPTAQA